MLPGPTFVKTFLRTYAEMLGLDPHVLVEEYRANYEGEDELELQPLGPPAALARDRGRRRAAASGLGSLALLVLVAVVGVLVVIGLLERRRRRRQRRPGRARTETTTERTTTQPKKARSRAPPKRVALRVVPATPTYVCVDRGAGTPVVFEGTIDTHADLPRQARPREPRQARRAALEERQARSRSRPARTRSGSPSARRATRELPPGERPCASGVTSLVGRERSRGHRRDRHRGPDRPRPRPQRPVAVRPPARAGRRARPHHDLRRPPAGHRGAAPLPRRRGRGPDRHERRARARRPTT